MRGAASRATTPRKRPKLAERDDAYVARRRAQLARAEARHRAKLDAEWVAATQDNAALREEVRLLRAAVDDLERGVADDRDAALAHQAGGVLNALLAEHALFLAAVRELHATALPAAGGAAWYVSAVMAAEAIDACRYEGLRLLAQSGPGAPLQAQEPRHWCAFTASIGMIRAPCATAEMWYAPHSLGASARVDCAFDAAAVGTDAMGVRNWLMRYVTDPHLVRRFFGVHSPIEKTTRLLPSNAFFGGASAATCASPPMPLPLTGVPPASFDDADICPTVQVVRLVEPRTAAETDFIVSCGTEVLPLAALNREATTLPGPSLAVDLADAVESAQARCGDPEACGPTNAPEVARSASASTSAAPLELRALRPHGVIRCHTVHRAGDLYLDGDKPLRDARVPDFSVKQSFYAWDEDCVDARGQVRRLVRFTMVGVVPGVFKRRLPSCVADALGAKPDEELTAMGYAYEMRHRALQIFSHSARAWLATPDSRMADRVVADGGRGVASSRP